MISLETGFERFEAICLGSGPGFPNAQPWLAARNARFIDRAPFAPVRYELSDEELNVSLIFLLEGGSNECAVAFGTDQPRGPFFAELTRRYGPRGDNGYFADPASSKLIYTQGSVTLNGQEHHRLMAIWPENAVPGPDADSDGKGNGEPAPTGTAPADAEPVS